jgi:hypothetical protein
MTFRLEYDRAVQRWIPASVAALGLFALSLFASNCVAQVNGTPASVTSPGFGGHSVNGTPASVTSVGRGGFTPSRSGATFQTQTPPRINHHRHDRDHDRGEAVGFYAVPYAVPYPVDESSDEAQANDDSEYQGGPTVFDRRGSGAKSYVPPVQDAPVAHASAVADPPESESPQDPTTLVFKDGHEIEVGNYAIVGRTLYDLTPGHSRKIALADLDLPATEKENDSRGATFQLPGSQAN